MLCLSATGYFHAEANDELILFIAGVKAESIALKASWLQRDTLHSNYCNRTLLLL